MINNGTTNNQLVIGVFNNVWNTGKVSQDGAIHGFRDIYRSITRDTGSNRYVVEEADISIFTDYSKLAAFLKKCDVVYANCGPWAALLHVIRDAVSCTTRIIREVRTVGWIGYIWQEDTVRSLLQPGDLCVYPSHYSFDMWHEQSAVNASVYYPLINNLVNDGQKPSSTHMTAGFFSAFSVDKGFDCLPEVVFRMQEHGHHIDRILLAGDIVDLSLFQTVAGKLEDAGVRVCYRGGLSNTATRNLMAQCDLVFFLSISSIETLGRIMLEAYEQSVPVVTADFGAAQDIVHQAYRIPVNHPDSVSGLSDTAFKVGDLITRDWSPPESLSVNDCYTATADLYIKRENDMVSRVLAANDAPVRVERAISFSYDTEIDALGIAHALHTRLEAFQGTEPEALIDLGGALKRVLINNHYNPQVQFSNNPYTNPVNRIIDQPIERAMDC